MSDEMRVDQWSISVAVDGSPIPGVWDKMTGGEMDSEETKYKPGGMQALVSLGGSQTPGNVVVSRVYQFSRDNDLCKALMNKAGRVNATVTKSPMDRDGHVYQNAAAALVYTGVLKRVTPPEPDSVGTGEARVEIEISTGGLIG